MEPWNRNRRDAMHRVSTTTQRDFTPRNGILLFGIKLSL